MASVVCGPLATKLVHDPKACLPLATKSELMLKELIEGMYNDGLFPSTEMLRKRLAEELEASSPLVDGKGEKSSSTTIEDLIEVARSMPDIFQIEEEPSRVTTYSPLLLGRISRPSARSITLVQTPERFQGFVNRTSGEDPYPTARWKSFEMYLENLARLVRSKITRKAASNPQNGSCEFGPVNDNGPHAFKGGSYEIACVLKLRRLPFFEGVRLGEIQHMVQLALGTRKLLVCVNNLTIPTAVFAKSSAFAERLPIDTTIIRSTKEFCDILQDILSGEEEGLNLSTLKEKIFEITNLRLDERVFGCPKLLDLLRLPEVARVCHLEKQLGKNTYRILPRARMPRKREPLIFNEVDIQLSSPFPPQALPPVYPQSGCLAFLPSPPLLATGPPKNIGYSPLPSKPTMIPLSIQTGTKDPSSERGLHQEELILRDGEIAYIPLPRAGLVV